MAQSKAEEICRTLWSSKRWSRCKPKTPRISKTWSSNLIHKETRKLLRWGKRTVSWCKNSQNIINNRPPNFNNNLKIAWKQPGRVKKLRCMVYSKITMHWRRHWTPRWRQVAPYQTRHQAWLQTKSRGKFVMLMEHLYKLRLALGFSLFRSRIWQKTTKCLLQMLLVYTSSLLS